MNYSTWYLNTISGKPLAVVFFKLEPLFFPKKGAERTPTLSSLFCLVRTSPSPCGISPTAQATISTGPHLRETNGWHTLQEVPGLVLPKSQERLVDLLTYTKLIETSILHYSKGFHDFLHVAHLSSFSICIAPTSQRLPTTLYPAKSGISHILRCCHATFLVVHAFPLKLSTTVAKIKTWKSKNILRIRQ